jgi:translocation and assembly module TamA
VGGTELLAGTVELRQRFLESFGVAAFVDAGEVSGAGKIAGVSAGGTLAVGAGVGARYFTAFGPIRLDVAVPLTQIRGDQVFQLYIGLGQAF